MSRPKLAGYEFQEVLGAGYFGEVWKARHETLQQPRAIKILRPDHYTTEGIQRLVAEAQRMAAVEHEHLVRVYDAKNGAANCFIIMEFLGGGTLASTLRDGRKMPWREAVKYVHQAALGLGVLHKHGLVHCDIKPDNIFVDDRTDRAILGDLGLAAPVDLVFESGAHQAYAAPEVLGDREYTFAADVYSLAATLFHVVTGRPLRPKSNPAALLANEALPATVRQALLAGLECEPSKRATLNRFSALLWDAYWQPVRERLDQYCRDHHPQINLRLQVSICTPDLSECLAAGSPADLKELVFQTGDLVKIDCSASTDGYLTVLGADSSGGFEIHFPTTSESGDEPASGDGQRPSRWSNKKVTAGDSHQLTFTLTPPGRAESLFVIWHKAPVTGTPQQWKAWLEGRARATRTRGAKFIAYRARPLPDKAFAYQQVIVAHERAWDRIELAG